MATVRQRKNTPAADNRSAEAKSASPITREDIAQRAYALYLARGGEEGHDMDDWLQAERELREENQA
jgi:hypothetical protein